MKKKAIVISRIKSEKIKFSLENIYDNIEYISAENYLNRTEEQENSDCDIIIATNPYKKKIDSHLIISKININGFKKIFYLNTFYRNHLDRYQYLKQKEVETLTRHLPILTIEIPFLISNEIELQKLQKRVNTNYYIPFITVDDLTEVINNCENTNRKIKFMNGTRKSMSLFPKSFQSLFWKNKLVRFGVINLFYKVVEKFLFLSKNSISTCYLTYKKDVGKI